MSTYFNVYLPLSGQDQDAPPVANDKFLIVCDGLGASGSTRHSVGNGETQKSAYLGSRKLSEICTRFFADNYNALLSETQIKTCIADLKIEIQRGLNAFLGECPRTEDSQGGAVFPTTLAAVIYKEESEYIKATVVWAGDSRVYMISAANWLQQLSRDDVYGEFDACFGKDCGMSNCVTQNEPFSINYACYKLPKRSVLFACSDGCFDFTPSPMFFELRMLEALFKTKEIDSELLSESFTNILKSMNCGDDCTLSGVVFNFDANEIREAIKHRVNPLKKLVTEYNDSGKVYEQTTNDKKTEIRALTSENKRLRDVITSKKRDFILSAFKEDIADKAETDKDQGLLNLSSFLKSSYKPYADYITALQENDEKVKEKIAERKQIVEEHKSAFDRLKDLAIDAEKEKRLKEKKEKMSHSYFQTAKNFFVSWGTKNVGAQVTETGSDPKIQFSDCRQEMEDLLCAFKDMDNICQPNIERFGLLANRLMDLLVQIDAELVEEAEKYEKMKASILSESEHPMLMKKVKEKGIGHYIGFIDEAAFENLKAAYREYKAVESRLTAINPDDIKEKTFEEKVSGFETNFLKLNLFKMLECVTDFNELNVLISENVQYQENQKKLDSIQNELDNGKDSQIQVWLKYKNNYEFYKECCYCGGV